MNFEYLNNMILYIEDNLTEDIEYKKLAKIVGMSEYNLQRIFAFLTGISISEYIRKRRLSKAFEELKTTDIRIIDLAIKYRYDSPISFSRAFKHFFNMTPSECKKSEKSYKLFPIITFNNNNFMTGEVKYQIKELESKVIYCFCVKDFSRDDLLFKIRKLYKSISNNDMYSKMYESGMYGISICTEDEYKYYVGSEIYFDNTERITIEAGKYVVFEVGSGEQSDIVKTYEFVYNRWLKSTNYEILDKPEIEFYEKNNCYIYFKIKDK